MTTSKLLIVDDERINLDFFDVMFSKLGFTVMLEDDGEAALSLLESMEDDELPDLIILDNLMPRMTGWELTKELKNNEDYERYASIPIIMFSAMDDVKDKIKGFELGIEDYITKPFNFSEVLARVRAVLRSHELASQVSHREKRIAVSESLNRSFLLFSEKLKDPSKKILARARVLIEKTGDPEMKEFIKDVIESSERLSAMVDALDDEILAFKKQKKEILEGEISIDDLNKKYQKHLDQYSLEV